MTEQRRLGLVVAVVGSFSCALSACESDQAVPRAAVEDSAGVRIVENGDVTGQVAPWRVSDEPLFRVGWAAEEPQFASVRYGAIMGDGNLAVADVSADRIYVLSRAGEVVSVIGRPGEGPGEFGVISGIVALGADTLLVQDGGNQRLSYFVGDALIRDARLEPLRGYAEGQSVFALMGVAGRLPGGDLLVLPYSYGYSPPPPDGWARMPIFRVSMDGEHVDTLARLDYWEFDGEGPGNVFSHVGASGVTPGGIVYGRSDVPEVRWLDEAGTVVQVARWAPEWEPLTDAVWLRTEEAYVRLRPNLEDAEFHERVARMKEGAKGPLPLFGSLHGDPEGNVWVGEYAILSDAPDTYWILTPEGEWLGRVDVPEALRVFQIGADVILGMETNEFDVQAVAAYRIEKEER